MNAAVRIRARAAPCSRDGAGDGPAEDAGRGEDAGLAGDAGLAEDAGRADAAGLAGDAGRADAARLADDAVRAAETGPAARADLEAGGRPGVGAGAAGRASQASWCMGREAGRAGRMRSLIRIIARVTPFSIRYVSFLCCTLQPYERRAYSTGAK